MCSAIDFLYYLSYYVQCRTKKDFKFKVKGPDFTMSDEFGNDFLIITDDDGNEFELEHLETIELNNQVYMAFLPADMDEEDEDFGIVILKVVEEDNEDVLVSINDEEELNIVFEHFVDLFSEESDNL